MKKDASSVNTKKKSVSVRSKAKSKPSAEPTAPTTSIQPDDVDHALYNRSYYY